MFRTVDLLWLVRPSATWAGSMPRHVSTHHSLLVFEDRELDCWVSAQHLPLAVNFRSAGRKSRQRGSSPLLQFSPQALPCNSSICLKFNKPRDTVHVAYSPTTEQLLKQSTRERPVSLELHSYRPRVKHTANYSFAFY